MRIFISCKSASQLVSQSLDAPLTWQSRLVLRLHLVICKYCRRFSQQLAVLRKAVQNMVQLTEADESIQLKPEARQRIINVIKQNQ
ncbi:MAG TPA: zf-HC2 domain-containing protein [Methylotenera sp.]|nr:zf-HC2 domain-containing protein [Methylotenera sp.]HPH05898.1 zf-HC2 domain-containing protein [Methylotenera sp.]